MKVPKRVYEQARKSRRGNMAGLVAFVLFMWLMAFWAWYGTTREQQEGFLGYMPLVIAALVFMSVVVCWPLRSLKEYLPKAPRIYTYVGMSGVSPWRKFSNPSDLLLDFQKLVAPPGERHGDVNLLFADQDDRRIIVTFRYVQGMWYLYGEGPQTHNGNPVEITNREVFQDYVENASDLVEVRI